ncbi:MAG: pyridoxamine 5'-phosphate oxidase family protein [Nitrososphaerota archaeon]|nr:pyridoxamine 5'-phosphate oxidase family protein [Nitrososphaerota archaeon]MDG7023472.1 pyridoxamine 5'-phosphate oxidase family protein [Nitrososphaerota archaeon]
MKNFEGEKGIGMSEREARRFLTRCRSTLILGTTDADCSPMIHPVWYYFDTANTRLYFYTDPALKKAANIKERSQVYFDVDCDRWPYKGVKGKGRARLVDAKEGAFSIASKILARYVKKGQPMIRSVLGKVKTGGYVVFEITPAYFTSWDYGKLVSQARGLKDSVIS